MGLASLALVSMLEKVRHIREQSSTLRPFPAQNEEIFFLSHDKYVAPHVSVRVMNYLKFMNSKVGASGSHPSSQVIECPKSPQGTPEIVLRFAKKNLKSTRSAAAMSFRCCSRRCAISPKPRSRDQSACTSITILTRWNGKRQSSDTTSMALRTRSTASQAAANLAPSAAHNLFQFGSLR